MVMLTTLIVKKYILIEKKRERERKIQIIYKLLQHAKAEAFFRNIKDFRFTSISLVCIGAMNKYLSFYYWLKIYDIKKILGILSIFTGIIHKKNYFGNFTLDLTSTHKSISNITKRLNVIVSSDFYELHSTSIESWRNSSLSNFYEMSHESIDKFLCMENFFFFHFIGSF